jgi:hypothetical protein
VKCDAEGFQAEKISSMPARIQQPRYSFCQQSSKRVKLAELSSPQFQKEEVLNAQSSF